MEFLPVAVVFILSGVDMKKICLFYFSGTGMTKYIIDRLSGEFEKHRVSLDCFKIDNVDIHNVAHTEYDIMGIAYPIHSFNAPKIVINFVKRLPKVSNMDIFIIPTAGEEHKINYASSDLLIKKLNKKGYKVFYNKLIEMPNNFIIKFSDEKVSIILERAKGDIPNIAKSILELKPCFMEKRIGSKVISFFGRIEWLGAPIMSKFYYVKEDCIRCGKCVNSCPNKNIIMNEKAISFKWCCGMCMRCIYQCPKNTIGVRQPFKFVRFDEWYDSKLFK